METTDKYLPGTPVGEQPGIESHFGYMQQLADSGMTAAGGPLFAGEGQEVVGAMLILRAESAEEARRIAAADPSGLLRVAEVRRFLLAVGELGAPPRTSAEEPKPAVRSVAADDVLGWIETGTGPQLLDVRSEREFAEGHLPGALNIPYDKIAERIEEVASFKDRGLALYCHSGRRAGIAAETLREAGFDNLAHVEGDMQGWLAAGLPLEK